MTGSATVLRIDGDFTGALLPRFESDVRSAVLAGSHVVLDMSNTAYIGADALASLIYVMNIARRWKRELWLAGLDRILIKLWELPGYDSSFAWPQKSPRHCGASSRS